MLDVQQTTAGKRAAPLVLRQQQQMMLVEILLNGQIDFETRIVVDLAPVADYGFTDIAEPAAVALHPARACRGFASTA